MTAVATGTASGFLDLYEKLRDFLTTNVDLVAAGEEWSVLAGPDVGPLTYTDEILFQGPGAAGTDAILVSTHVSYNVGADYYNLGFSGYSAYNPGLPLADQANRLAPLWSLYSDSSMPYWLIANGRRFIVVVRVGSVYQSAYCGFILPYHLPTSWAYPLYIGASVSNSRSGFRYADVSGHHGSCFDPGTDGAAIRLPDGTWKFVANSSVVSNTEVALNINNTSPWHPYFRPANTAQAIDGTPVLVPGELSISDPFAANLGALEGVWHVSGFSIIPEDIITVSGVDYLVVPNAYRTGVNEIMAVALE